MRCPRCSFEQPAAAVCERCGVIVDRVRARPVRPAVSTARRPRPPREPLPWDLGLGLLALVALAVWLWPRSAAPPAPQGAVSAGRRPEPAVSRSTAAPPSPPAPVGRAPAATVAPMPPVTARCPLADAVEPAGGPDVPPYWFTGASGYEDAVRRQSSSATPLVVYFFTDWCRYCKQIDRELFASSEVERYLNRAVLRVRVNPEAGEAERRLADRFRVTGYPSFFVQPASTEEPRRCSLYAGADARKPATLPQLQERIEGESLRFAQRLIHAGYERRRAGDPASAVTMLDQAVAAAPREADAWMQRAVAREEQGALDEALADYGMAAVLRPGGRAHERAVHALLRAERFDEAVACATDWMRREPNERNALRQRARAHHRRGDEARAREDAERACTLGDVEACRVAGRG